VRIDLNGYPCALCGFEDGEALGGAVSDSSGSFLLCHRDHSNGETCYEQVSRSGGIAFGVTFAEAIEQIKSRKHTEFAHGLRMEYFRLQEEYLAKLVERIEDSQKAR